MAWMAWTLDSVKSLWPSLGSQYVRQTNHVKKSKSKKQSKDNNNDHIDNNNGHFDAESCPTQIAKAMKAKVLGAGLRKCEPQIHCKIL